MASKLETFINNVHLFAANANAYIKILLTHYNTRRIVVNGIVFNWAKKPSNNTNTLAANEVISNGRISDNIHIYSAVYKGTGSIDSLGTEAQYFTDGSYKNVNYEKF